MQSRWLILTIVILFLVMAVAAWLQPPKTVVSKPTAPGFRTYTDPNKVFSVAVPPSWNISPSTATSTTGLNTGHPVTQSIQITQFSKPAEMGVTVQVISGQPTCPLKAQPTTSLAGLPASYNPAIYTWTIPTTTSTVMVSVAYPGTHSFHGRLQPTFSAETAQADKQLVESVLQSLKFSDLKPFSCI